MFYQIDSGPEQSLTRVSISRKSREEMTHIFLSRAGELYFHFSFSSRFTRFLDNKSLSFLDFQNFKTKRQKDKNSKRPERGFHIVMSGQFCTLAVFLNVCVCVSKQKMMQAATGEQAQ